MVNVFQDWNDFLNSFKKVQFCVVHGAESDVQRNLQLQQTQDYKDGIPNLLNDGSITDFANKNPDEIM